MYSLTLKAVHCEMAEAFNFMCQNMGDVGFKRATYKKSKALRGTYLSVEIEPPKKTVNLGPFISQ